MIHQPDSTPNVPSTPPLPAFMQTTARPPDVIVRGEGSYLWDESGARYLDFVQGWAVNLFGHCPAEVVAAVARQAGTLITPSPAYFNAPVLELARRLTARTCQDQAYFGVTGADANEAAIKLSRKWGRAHKAGAFEILTTVGGFHGRTLATMAATGKPGFDRLFPPAMPGFRKVPYGDLPEMERAITPATVAILVEPIQGEAGVVMPPPGYVAGLRELADRRDLLLIADEIQTGMHRTGPFLAVDAEGVRPDIVTLGKGLGGGVAISALLCTRRAGAFDPGEQGGTFHNNPLSAAAALAVLDCIDVPDFVPAIHRASERLRATLLRVSDAVGATLRGRGHLWAIELPTPSAHAVRDVCHARGLLVNAAQPNVLRVMPSLRTSYAEIDAMGTLLSEALLEIVRR